MPSIFWRFLSGRRAGQPARDGPDVERARGFLESGDAQQAERLCRRVVEREPASAAAHGLLGRIALERGQTDAAVRHLSRAIELDPDRSSFHQGLGIAYFTARQFPDALRCFERGVALDRKNPAAHNNLGNCHKQAGKLKDAAQCYRKAIWADRAYLPAYVNLADVQGKQRKHKAAVKTYQMALRIGAKTPENSTNLVLLHHRLGLALRELDRTDDAIASYREALRLQPDFALAHNSLGGALLARNELEDALDCFRRALEFEPGHYRVHSNVLLTMNYLADTTQEQIYAESLRYDTMHARALLDRTPFRNSKSRKKVLRVGYLSPDFREHSVAFFTRKLLGEHDREAVEVFCYADVETPDDLTSQFQAQADQWLSIVEHTDAEIAARIRQDGIDILVDLAGHTSNNRLPVFARKPAPIQVNWLGYPNTSGMQAMDYRLTDAVADPPGDADALHVETLVRLEHGFLCYQPEESGPAVSPPPCLQSGCVTFGSFNMIRKIAPGVVRTWARILQAVPDSRLLLKSHALEDRGTRERLLRAFAEAGIGAPRLELVNAVPRRHDHMAVYSRVDIGLDPFPYNGTTTTFEALWMGAPVVCLRGDRHAGRVGASVMHHLGMPELVAEDLDAYVDLATRLAADPGGLASRRRSLRDRLRDSVLMDVPRFCETLEEAYREMWLAWCAAGGRKSRR